MAEHHNIHITLSNFDRDTLMGWASNKLHTLQSILRDQPPSPSGRKMMEDEITQAQRILQALCNKPVHVHDCDKCTYLGTTYGWLGVGHDLYYCPMEPTLLARHGSDGDEYTSSLEPVVLEHSPLLREALKRALAVEEYGELIDHRALERLEDAKVINNRWQVIEQEGTNA